MAKGKAGAPRKHDRDKVCSEIFARMVDEERSATDILREMGIPNSTFFRWTGEDPDIAENYARAEAVRASAMFDEMLRIVDDGSNDWMERLDEEGQSQGWKLNGEHVQRSRLRFDARRWILAKMAPKRFGERVTHEHEGGDRPIEIIEDVIVRSDRRQVSGK